MNLILWALFCSLLFSHNILDLHCSGCFNFSVRFHCMNPLSCQWTFRCFSLLSSWSLQTVLSSHNLNIPLCTCANISGFQILSLTKQFIHSLMKYWAPKMGQKLSQPLEVNRTVTIPPLWWDLLSIWEDKH